jgi:chromosome segregation ATPase
MEDAKISTESLVTERLRVTLAETEAERDELRAKYRELQCQQDESHYQRALRLEKQLADAERRAEEAVELVHQQANEQLAKLTERAEKLERLLNESVAEYDRRGLRLSEAQAQNAELQRSERTLAQQRDRAHENLARVTAMNAELRRALEGLAADVRERKAQGLAVSTARDFR